MKNYLLIVLSFFCYFFATIVGILIFPAILLLWLLTVLFDKRLVFLHKLTIFWAKIYIWMVPLWKMKVSNRQKINKKQKYVIVSNHQSIIDILLLYQLHAHFKFVARSEVFRVPIIGWTMTLSRHIILNKQKKAGVKQMIKKCSAAIQKRSSILIFPEGTRSKDGTIQPFKEGAFKIAIENETPVLPVVIEGTYNAVPKGNLLFKNHADLHLSILDPLPYSEFMHLNAKETARKVRELMIAEHHKLVAPKM